MRAPGGAEPSPVVPPNHLASVNVVRGDPTPEELAAVMACLVVASAGRPAADRGVVAEASGWTRAARTGLLRSTLLPMRGWRGASGPGR